jgi:hypothetical protein
MSQWLKRLSQAFSTKPASISAAKLEGQLAALAYHQDIYVVRLFLRRLGDQTAELTPQYPLAVA